MCVLERRRKGGSGRKARRLIHAAITRKRVGSWLGEACAESIGGRESEHLSSDVHPPVKKKKVSPGPLDFIYVLVVVKTGYVDPIYSYAGVHVLLHGGST